MLGGKETRFLGTGFVRPAVSTSQRVGRLKKTASWLGMLTCSKP